MKNITIIAAFIFASLSLTAQTEKLKVTYENVGEGLFEFYADNPTPYPMQLMLTFTEFDNMHADVDLPFISTIQPGMQRIFLVTRTYVEAVGSFKYETKSMVGAYPVEPDNTNAYILPVEIGKTTTAKILDYAKYNQPEKVVYTFSMKADDKVCAAREGTVCQLLNTRVIDGKTRGRNTIVLLHADNTFGKYENMVSDGFLVEVGDSISAGQEIGIIDAANPNLTFSVYYTNQRIDTILEQKLRNYYTFIQPEFQVSKKKKAKLEDTIEYSRFE